MPFPSTWNVASEEVRAGLGRVRDRQVVFRTRVGSVDSDRERRFRGWAFAGATPVAEEIERALEEAGTPLVERLFLLDPDLPTGPTTQEG